MSPNHTNGQSDNDSVTTRKAFVSNARLMHDSCTTHARLMHDSCTTHADLASLKFELKVAPPTTEYKSPEWHYQTLTLTLT